MSNTTGNYASSSIKNIINLVNAKDSKFNLMPVLNSLTNSSSNYNNTIRTKRVRAEEIGSNFLENAQEAEKIGFNFLKSTVLQKYEDGQPRADDNIATQDDKDKIIGFLRKYEECASQDKEIPREFFLELKEFVSLTEAKIRELNENTSVNFKNLTISDGANSRMTRQGHNSDNIGQKGNMGQGSKQGFNR